MGAEVKQVRGIWLPDGDTHFEKELPNNPLVEGRATYQHNKYVRAARLVRRFRHALDIGAHVGLWSRIMAIDFEAVTAIEPLEMHRECLVKNVPEKVTIIPAAAGAERRRVNLSVPPDNTGSAHLVKGETVEMQRVDDLDLSPVDFIKIDVEGWEFDVVLGAEQTIRRDRPVMVVEQKAGLAERYGREQTEAVGLLKSWGMHEAKVIGGDHIMAW